LITPFLHIFHEPAEKESNMNQVIALEKIKTVQKITVNCRKRFIELSATSHM
jgi:hypothetical protein